MLLRSGKFVDLTLKITLTADPDGGKTQMQLVRSAEMPSKTSASVAPSMAATDPPMPLRG